MRNQHYYYLSSDMKSDLQAVVTRFVTESASPEMFLNEIKEKLPVEWSNQFQWKASVEGFFFTAQVLFGEVLQFGQSHHGDEWTRETVVYEAGLRPLSSYHWSSLYWDSLSAIPTSDDYLNDPTTALVKLKDDILALSRLLRKLQTIGVATSSNSQANVA